MALQGREVDTGGAAQLAKSHNLATFMQDCATCHVALQGAGLFS